MKADTYFFTYAGNSTIHNSQGVETTRVSRNERINKTWSIRILFSFEKKGRSDTCYHTDGP